MQSEAQLDDETVMSLAEQALVLPKEEREVFLEASCVKQPELRSKTLHYVFWEERMKGSCSRMLITIDAGNVAPGTGITLPGPAATLLAPKGNIAIAQLKWTLPIMNGVVKIPFSFTWSNRTELIDESEKRGQVGITLDLDAVFAKGSQ